MHKHFFIVFWVYFNDQMNLHYPLHINQYIVTRLKNQEHYPADYTTIYQTSI